MFFGAPYVASRDDKLQTILQLIKEIIYKDKKYKKLPSDLDEKLITKNVKPTPKIADLGSGNGKILIAIAQLAYKFNIPVTLQGYEINPLLVWYSRLRIERSLLLPFLRGGWVGSPLTNKNNNINKTIRPYSKIKINNRSYFSTDLSQYDIITLYATTYIMKRLEKKLKNELQSGAIVISNYFKFPNWKPVKSVSQIHLYSIA